MRRSGIHLHHLHHRSFSLLALIVLFSSLCVSTVPLHAEPTLPWRDKGTPFGVVGSLGNRVRSDEMPAAVQLMREAGVQWQREEIFWHEVQTSPGGPYNWNGEDSGFYNYDRSIGLQAEAGIHVLGLLDYNPAWFKGKNPRPEEWIKDWGDFVYNAVAHYGRDKGWVKHWELWNEPNLARSGYESGLYNIGDFARILDVGRAAAKAADPDAVIVLGGLASMWGAAPSPYNYDYLDYLQHLGDSGAWNSFDVIAIHPYRPDAPEGEPWRNTQHADMRDEFNLLDKLLLKYGPKPVWITELGWTSSTGVEGVDEDTQAFFMTRSYILAIAHPSVEKLFWYDLRDDASPGSAYDRPNYNSHDPEFHYGLMRRSYPLDANRGDLRKPAFLAYRTLTSMLGGLSFAGVAADGNPPDHQGFFWYRFAGSNRRVDVLWRTGDSSPTQTVQCDCREALVRGWNG